MKPTQSQARAIIKFIDRLEKAKAKTGNYWWKGEKEYFDNLKKNNQKYL